MTISHLAASAKDMPVKNSNEITGDIVDLQGERYYAIYNVDKMPPFFISVVSAYDHWLYISSNGGLTSGRVSPETALFPYVSVDKVHESAPHTGSKTLLRVETGGSQFSWEPFNREHDDRFQISRHLYKNLLGNKLCFEELNHDLNLVFRYTWMSSDRFGFVRYCELQNLSGQSVRVDMLDGLQNIQSAGTPSSIQASSSNLVNAYKWTELDRQTGLAYYTLYSAISDRPEPCESLRANTVFCFGLEGHEVLISSEEFELLRTAAAIPQAEIKRGVRGAYYVHHCYDLEAHDTRNWQLVANINQSQSDVVKLRRLFSNPGQLSLDIRHSVDEGSDRLARIVSSADGFQSTAEENISLHHYSNVLFNTMRGGIFNDQYQVSSQDFLAKVAYFNQPVLRYHRSLLTTLPEDLPIWELLDLVRQQGDYRLERLAYEYLPIIFGRRHGDPSRPWNKFEIRLKDKNENPLLTYQGNWRDIFQNWEALLLSYPEFIENIIAKFVNTSTADGYNPYRITSEGFDWEIEDPDDPWSCIGYWGDHQIIYLLKLLELSQNYHPEGLSDLLHRPIFCYANVPYRISCFDSLLENPKNTVSYDQQMADVIEQRVAKMGADGKLLLDRDGEVYQVNLLEKLLVPLLSKLANLVIDGGIWLNTQRPEWNDANNALVGQGLSMVTLYYLRRYINFLHNQIRIDEETVTLSLGVSCWLNEAASALANMRKKLDAEGKPHAAFRFDTLVSLGQAASRYREKVYNQCSFGTKQQQKMSGIRALFDDALAVIDHSISSNRRADNLYHAYNLLSFDQEAIETFTLSPMLEGQVAALSSGAVEPEQAIEILEALFASDMYREDQQSFMLYPDRRLPGFLQKNIISAEEVARLPILQRMMEEGNESILIQDADNNYRFNPDIINRGEMESRLSSNIEIYGEALSMAQDSVVALYERVFNHQKFTGRSGGMFGFEGLGCIYWHMVSKLLLAVQEQFFTALEQGDSQVSNRLGQLYYRVRYGLGFNKSPQEYGAFPTDPYSHTPGHGGAKQPGMTGQVKEEILTRFGELGIRVSGGAVSFLPTLLRASEFSANVKEFKYLDVRGNWRTLMVPKSGLAFTWCQVPIVYQLEDISKPRLSVHFDSGDTKNLDRLCLDSDFSKELFLRSGRIRQLTLILDKTLLFDD